MGIDLRKAEIAVQHGLAFPCALCSRHWEGLEKGFDSCARLDCGGPLGGLTFPQYTGQLPAEAWKHFCFRCGSPNNLIGIKVVGSEKLLAICESHRDLIDDAEAGATAPTLNEIVFRGEREIGQAPAKGKILFLGPVESPLARTQRLQAKHSQPCRCGKCPG